ncbi:carbohydrate ABC transporter substrate-binding protein [Streptomyces sp. NPDC101225]|uniref:carbohydrate ABC transporter substrate-binding protein n=1 Tax=Streptomyces sp. NPDC101225 TaxID=3366135 RepID=UPI00382C75DE
MTRRFTFLVLLVVMLMVAAVGVVVVWTQHDDEEPVTILGTWTGQQEQQFKTVLRSLGVPFRYQGTAAQREVLLSKVQSGEPPDVVIMPGIGELAEYRDQNRLKPLDHLYDPQQYGAPWNAAGTASGHVFWVPVKADLKSIVWYREGHRPADTPAPMSSWCMGMGDDGASGWPGTDWIEDLVLQRAGPGFYARWALNSGGPRHHWWTSTEVRSAWTAWARLLEQDRPAARTALLTDHRGAPGGHGLLFGGAHGCTLEHQGSFARSFYGPKDTEHARLTDSAALLPGGGTRVRAHEVTGDFAALFSERAPARELIRRLSSKRAQQKWAEVAGVFSANRQVVPKDQPVERQIAERLLKGPRCLDASDVMAPAVRDAFYEAVLLTMARVAAKDDDPRIGALLENVQRVQDVSTKNTRHAALQTVCSTH